MVRKSAPKVINGEVRKKNNWSLSPDYYDAPQPRMVMVDRKRPGDGYKHVLNKSDIPRFLEILPDWNRLAVGLNAIVLAPGEWSTDGYHVPGVVHICAWETELWREHSDAHHEAHKDILERLGVVSVDLQNGYHQCQFDEKSVRDYQLLHILLHELGHHHDRMTTRRQKDFRRGEPYAENYALHHEAVVWERYHRAFPR